MDFTQTYSGLFPIIALFVIALAFAGGAVLLSYFMGPRRPSRVKSEAYECGIDPVGDARLRFSVKFYIIAMLFILFDIEAIFLYPWAVMFNQLKLFGIMEMFAFLGFLLMGYIYLWRRGALEWD
jgi:NADH-quinone oxidoreductase subunit A